MYDFNTLYRPWIPARGKNGDIREYGIMELLACSPELDAVVDAAPPFEYGMYRLLLTFLADVYRPESTMEIEDLLEEASFDMTRLQAYAKQWERHFDLFDTEHPFLQAPFDLRWDTETGTKSVANLIPEIPSGHGHVHFLHCLETAHRIAPAIAARALCASTLFTPAMVQGYPSGVNGSPPWFTMVRGSSLFETLALNLWVPNVNLQDYDERVIWKSDRMIVPKEEVKDISYIEGLLFPNRRVLLLPGEGGVCTYSGQASDCLIDTIHYKQGLNFTAYGLWIDPHTTRRTSGEDAGTMKPDANRALWRDIGSILLQERVIIKQDKKETVWHRPPVVSQLERMERAEAKYPWIATCSYGLALDQAKQLVWMKQELAAPRSLMGETPLAKVKTGVIQAGLQDAEKAANALRIAIRSMIKMEKDRIKLDQVAVRTYRHFWSSMESVFFQTWMPALQEVQPGQEPTWQQRLRKMWFQIVCDRCRTLFQQAMDQVGRSGKILMQANHVRGYLEAVLYGLNPDKPPETEENKAKKKARR